MSTFSQPSSPSSGDQFNAVDHRGHLLLVYPKAYQAEVPTKNGPSSAADADIVIVDKLGPDGKPLFFSNTRLFGNLANSVRNDIGGQVLGRLDQINTQGGRTPWILQEFTDQEKAMAMPVHTAYQQGQFKPTQNPMSAQTPQGAAPTPSAYQPPQQNWDPTPAPAAPTPGPAPAPQQQQWNAPTPAPAAAPAAVAYDPQLAAFLQSRGITPPPDEATARAIAAMSQ